MENIPSHPAKPAELEVIGPAPDGLRVNFRGTRSRSSDSVFPGTQYAVEAMIASRGRSEDIAYGVLYLASGQWRSVRGSELVIAGGFAAR